MTRAKLKSDPRGQGVGGTDKGGGADNLKSLYQNPRELQPRFSPSADGPDEINWDRRGYQALRRATKDYELGHKEKAAFGLFEFFYADLQNSSGVWTFRGWRPTDKRGDQ